MALDTWTVSPTLNNDPYGGNDWLPSTSNMTIDNTTPVAAQSSGGFLSGLGALLQQAGSTAIDIIGAKAKAGITSTPANINPDSNNAAMLAQQQQNAISNNYMPWIIGGGVAVGAVVLLVMFSKR